MQGYFDISLKNAGGLDDDFFLKAQREGRIMNTLADLKTDQETHGQNLMTEGFAANYFYFGMGGDGVTDPWDQSDGTPSCFWAIQLDSTSDEVGYQDRDFSYNSGQFPRNQEMGNYVSTSGIKRFIDDDIEAVLVATDYEGLGIERIRYRSRWLWLPSQGNSSNIKSLVIVYNSDGNRNVGTDYAADRAPIARIRIKDSAGNPTTINKTSSQVLFVEYTVYLVSV